MSSLYLCFFLLDVVCVYRFLCYSFPFVLLVKSANVSYVFSVIKEGQKGVAKRHATTRYEVAIGLRRRRRMHNPLWQSCTSKLSGMSAQR